MSRRLAQAARNKLIGDLPNDWQTYYRYIAEALRPGMRVLDVGCGVGDITPFPWKSHPEVELWGIDPDPAASQNANLSRFELLADFAHWPIEERAVDLIVSRYTLEHVEKPDEFFANVVRVLRPGGRFIALSPNRFHPTMIASAVLPLKTKQRILKATQGIEEDDVFPTFYRLNTVRKICRFAKKFGLNVRVATAREYVPNGYLDFNVAGFFLSYAYYQAVRWLYLERWLGISIIVVLEKPACDANSSAGA